MADITIDWERYAKCNVPMDADGHQKCDCPWVVYENVDGRCWHKACEGPQADCGRIVEVQ